MATDRQITANRRNARKSTGPRSSAGKSASKRNALAHGLRAAEVLLPDEDESVYRQFQQEVFDQLMPGGAVESELVERIVGYLWRLRRCRRIEANLLGGGPQIMDSILNAAPEAHLGEWSEAQFLRENIIRRLESPSGYVQSDPLIDTLPNQDLVDAYQEADKREKQRNPLTYDISVGFSDVSSRGDMLSKLARYETGLDRAFYRCLHELQRLQAIRMNQPLSTPPILDIDVTIEDS